MDPPIYPEGVALDDDALALVYPSANAQARQSCAVPQALQSQSYGNLGMAADAECLPIDISGVPDISTLLPAQHQLGVHPTHPHQLSWAGGEPWSPQTAVPQQFESPDEYLRRVGPEGDGLEQQFLNFPSSAPAAQVPHIQHDAQWPVVGGAAATLSVISSSDAAYLAARRPSLTMGTTAPSMGREGSNYSMFGTFQGLRLGSRTSDSVADQSLGDNWRLPPSPAHPPYLGRGRDSVDLACLGAAVDPTRLPTLMENSLTEDLSRTSSIDSRGSAEQRLKLARQQHIENGRKQTRLQPAQTQPPPLAPSPARKRALSESHGNSRRQRSSKLLCHLCRVACRGPPELDRHMKRDHSSRKVQYQIVDPQTGGPLPGCKRCALEKKYNTNYNAAEHLRRIHSEHLREALIADPRETSSSRWPPMEALRPWLRQVTTHNDAVADEEGSEDELALEEPPRRQRKTSRQSHPPVAVNPASTARTSTGSTICAASRQYGGEAYSQVTMGRNRGSLQDAAEAFMLPAAPDNTLPLMAAGGTHVDMQEHVAYATPAPTDPCMPDFMAGGMGADFPFGIGAYSDGTDAARFLDNPQDPTWDFVNLEP